MNNKDTNAFIQVIQQEHQKIDDRWLRLHHKTVIWLVLVGFLMEGVLATSMYYLDHGNMALGKTEYFIRYVLLPISINTSWMLVSIWAMRTPRLSSRARAYIISLVMTGICFVFYSAHYNFSLSILFFGPVLFTVIYGNYRMATAVAAINVSAKIISDLFINWNTGKIHPFSDVSTIIGFIVSVLILVVFYVISIVIIHFQREKNNASIQKEIERYEMQQQLVTDPLTKIYNRVALRDAFNEMEADTANSVYYFAMTDLDNFKQINDTLGHEKGDRCLVEVGRTLKECCASDAIPFRFAGDEFCVLFKNKTMEEVLGILRCIQNALRQNTLAAFGIPVTISIGVAGYTRDMTSTQLLQRADIALYRSKEQKDMISFSEEDSAGTLPSD